MENRRQAGSLSQTTGWKPIPDDRLEAYPTNDRKLRDTQLELLVGAFNVQVYGDFFVDLVRAWVGDSKLVATIVFVVL
jgi:hypothetical protein